MNQKYILIDDQRRQNAIAFINSLPITGKRKYQVDIRLQEKPRTDKQNRSLWGVAYPAIMEAMGLQGEEGRQYLHNLFCREYFGEIVIDVLGEKYTRPRRTTTTDENGKKDYVSTEVMIDFYSFIQRKAADFGIYVPDPDPLWWQNK